MKPRNEALPPVLTEELGNFLRQLRREGRHTQEDTARGAAISRRTLLRWEAGQAQPRVPELHALLTALRATEGQREHALWLMAAPRARRALRETPPGRAASGSDVDRSVPVGGGDLLRAMRLRRHLPLEQVAAQIRVASSTLSRWERGEVLPTDAALEPLLTLLGAHTQERAALTEEGRWLQGPPHDNAPTTSKTVTELREQWEQLCAVVYADVDDALLDLHFLSLEVRLGRVAEHPAGRELLAQVLAHHANHLLVFYRFKEAGHYAQRALALLESASGSSGTTRKTISLRAGIVVAESIAYRGSRSATERALELLRRYQPQAPSPGYVAWVRANEAKYLSLLGYCADAVAQTNHACRIAAYCDEPVELILRHRDLAQLYLQSGRPEAALPLIHEWDMTSPIERATASLLRAQALHALREPTAADHLSRAVADIAAHDLRHLQPQAALLAKRLS